MWQPGILTKMTILFVLAEFRTPDRAEFSIPPFRTGKMGRGAPGMPLNIFPSAVKGGTPTLSCPFWTAIGYTGSKGRTRQTCPVPKGLATLCAHIPSQ